MPSSKCCEKPVTWSGQTTSHGPIGTEHVQLSTEMRWKQEHFLATSIISFENRCSLTMYMIQVSGDLKAA